MTMPWFFCFVRNMTFYNITHITRITRNMLACRWLHRLSRGQTRYRVRVDVCVCVYTCICYYVYTRMRGRTYINNGGWGKFYCFVFLIKSNKYKPLTEKRLGSIIVLQ